MPSIPRSILSIFAGYIVIAFIVAVCTWGCMVALHLRSGHPTPVYLALNAVYSLFAGFMGGYMAAKFAAHKALLHGAILAAILFVASLLMFRHSVAGQPLWYRILLVLGPPLLVLYGSSRVKPQTLPESPA